MRVLLAHNNYAVEGGAEVFFHEVGRVLTERGHQVAYLSAYDALNKTPWDSYFPAVAAYRSGAMFTKIFKVPKSIYNMQAKKSMARLIQDFKPDIIHVFAAYVKLTPSILDAARQANVPVVMSCNDYKHICPNYKMFHHGQICEECNGGRFIRATVNRCCHNSIAYSLASTLEAYVHSWMDIYRKNVSKFLFASEFMAKKTEQFWGKGTFDWDMLPNPFDTKNFQLSGEVGDFALYFGRLIGEKGVDVLLDAATIAREVPIVVVGDGPDRGRLEVKAKEGGLSNVSFLGAKWGDALSEQLRRCRFVVVPSLWHENYPYVILQAFAAGKPVLGSNRGGIPELIGDSRGWIYDATNPSMLADAMRKVAATPNDELRDRGENARQFVASEFNDTKFYERLMRIYGDVSK